MGNLRVIGHLLSAKYRDLLLGFLWKSASPAYLEYPRNRLNISSIESGIGTECGELTLTILAYDLNRNISLSLDAMITILLGI